MKKRIKWLLLTLFIALLALALFLWSTSTPPEPRPLPTVKRIGEHELQVIGLHTERPSVQHVIALLTPDITTLRLSSFGGPVEDAMDLADAILDRKIAVHIDGICMSSCANYLFPAGSETRVLPGSLVCIHGSVSTDRRWFFRQLSRSTIERERLLFERIDLSPSLFTSEDHPTGDDQFYCPTREDWEAAGLKSLTQFWYPGNLDEMNQIASDFVKKHDPERDESGQPIPLLQGRFD